MTHSPQHTPARHSTFIRLVQEGWKSPHLVILALISTICVTAFDALIPLIAGTTIDAATGAQTASTNPAIITQLSALIIAVALGRYLVQFGRRYLAGALSHTLHFQLRTRIVHTLLRLDGPSHDTLSTGQIVTRSISDLNAVQIMVAMAPLLFGNIVQVIVTVCIIFVISPLLCAIAVAMIPLLVGLSIYSRKVLFASTWSAQQTLAEMNSHIEETLSGVRVVKAFAQEERETNTLTQHAGEVYQHMMRTARMSARLKPLMQQLPSIALVITIGAGGYITYTGTITIGTFLAFSVYMTALTSVVSMLAGMVVQMQLGLASAQRVFDVLDIAAHAQPAALNAANSHHASAHALSPDTVDEGWGIDIDHINYNNVLTDLTFTLEPASRTALIGPPGSGKTLLTYLLGGFYQPQSGHITLTHADTRLPYTALSLADIRTHVTCVFDEPFLFSTTIRDNLDFGRGFSDNELYDAARIACIDTFIASLPNGLDTPIGERGHRLSGGQRQRIALARAILTQPAILILDDTTSAVDATTEAQIFANLSTHLPHTTLLIIAHRHSTLEYADHIAVLDHGMIVGIGTRDQMRSNPQLRTLMNLSLKKPRTNPQTPALTTPTTSEPSWEELWPNITNGHTTPTHDTATKATMSRGVSGTSGTVTSGVGTQMAGAMPQNPQLVAQIDKLPTFKDTPPHGGYDQFRQPLTHVDARTLFGSVKHLIAFVVGLYIIGVLAGLGLPYLIKIAIDSGIQQSNPNVLVTVSLYGLGLTTIAWASMVGTTILTALTGERLLYELRIRCYAHLQRLSLDYYESTTTGALITRMSTDIDSLNSFLNNGFSTAIVAVTTLSSILILLGVTSPLLLCIALTGVPVIALATYFFKKISSRLYTRAREEVSEVNSLFHETMTGLRTAQMLNQEQLLLTRFSTAANTVKKTRIHAQTAVAVYFPGLNATSEIIQAIVLGIGAHLVANSTLEVGILIAFLLYLDRLYGPIHNLSQIYDSYQQARVGFTRITDLLSTPASVTDDNAEVFDVDTLAQAATRTLSLHNVHFSYPNHTTHTPALNNINLQITPGTTVAIVGETGAGKSTIIKLIERFYDPQRGHIAAGNHPLTTLPLHGWRSHVGFVPQEAHLFNGTIADNIAYARPNASKKDIVDAARRVGALPIFASIDGGLNATVGHRGNALSSGQRQLVALARAEMLQPALLLLDEATATLDPATESAFLNAMEKATHNRTAIVVAHRLATAHKADRILVIRDGCIVEDGTHTELLSFGGIYATMWAATTKKNTSSQKHCETEHNESKNWPRFDYM